MGQGRSFWSGKIARNYYLITQFSAKKRAFFMILLLVLTWFSSLLSSFFEHCIYIIFYSRSSHFFVQPIQVTNSRFLCVPKIGANMKIFLQTLYRIGTGAAITTFAESYQWKRFVSKFRRVGHRQYILIRKCWGNSGSKSSLLELPTLESRTRNDAISQLPRGYRWLVSSRDSILLFARPKWLDTK